MRFNLASAPISNLHPAEKYERFVEGLKPHIRKEHILHYQDDSLDFATAARYATRYDVVSTFASTSSTSTPPPRPLPPPYHPPIARLNAIAAPSTVHTGGHTPLTPELRDAINAKGGCTYCRNTTPPLHTIYNCLTRRPRPSWVLGNGRSQ